MVWPEEPRSGDLVVAMLHPHWLVDEIEGEYRLRWDLVEGGVLQNDFEIEGGLPATVYSNTFTVRVADPD